MNATEPVSLSALAKILGRSKSGLHYLEKVGHISRDSSGKFDIAEVQSAIARNVDATMAHRRKQSAARCATRSNRVRLDGKWVTFEQAEAERDRCLRLLAEIRNSGNE